MQMPSSSSFTQQYNYTSTLNAFQVILKSEGVMGLYRGCLPNYLKVVPAVSVSFVSYEFVKNILE